MKKILSYLICLTLVFSFVGCSKNKVPKEDTVVNNNEIQNEVKKEEVTNEYVKMMNTDTRPVAVMIDNDSNASRPQIGLESAYMVYEIIVEGGASRLMALFKNHDLEKVGPVRSARHYFLDYAFEHDAIYTHAGWSPKAQSDIQSLKVNNINGILGDDGNIYWRDTTYDRTYHNLYTGVDKLYDKAVNVKGYKGTTSVKHTPYANEEYDLTHADKATRINLPYSGFYKVSYEYDDANKVYKRFVDSNPHMSQTGEQLTAKNIIIYSLKNYDLTPGDKAGRQDIKNIGWGTGYYVTNGQAIDIKWTKDSRKGRTVYETLDGEEIKLNPGNTYIQIMPESMKINIK